MIYTIAYLFRKNSLSRAEFREYYETRHTHLARRTLPEFNYYRRNHVLESTDDAQCPDSFSEFGYGEEKQLLETMAIIGDGRGQALMDDELQFMNKARNQIYPAQPTGVAPTQNNIARAYKTVVVVRGADGGRAAWLDAWRSIDPSLQHTMSYAELGGAGDEQLHWLMGWSSQLSTLAQLQRQFIERAVPVLWCASVDERIGYPQ